MVEDLMVITSFDLAGLGWVVENRNEGIVRRRDIEQTNGDKNRNGGNRDTKAGQDPRLMVAQVGGGQSRPDSGGRPARFLEAERRGQSGASDRSTVSRTWLGRLWAAAAGWTSAQPGRRRDGIHRRQPVPMRRWVACRYQTYRKWHRSQHLGSR